MQLKWKRFKGAIFEENVTGRARLEIYTSGSQLAALTPSKSILLGECVAIRIVHFRNTVSNDNRIIQIQPRNAPVLLIAVENVDEWHYVLCKVAFPDQMQKPPLRSTLSFRNERGTLNLASSDSRSRFPFFRLKKEWKEREKFELDAKDEWIRYSKENLSDMYNNDFYQTKLPERSYMRIPNVPNAHAFQRDLERTIAKRALCLSLSSEALSGMDNNSNKNNNDSNSNSQNRKVILRPRIILDGDLLDPTIFTPSTDNLENDSGVGSLQARIRDSVVSAPSPSPVNCNPNSMHSYFRQSLIN
uniref:Bm5075 n=1 Tax=Brugia malayi TaxID=6279 RepID=A0A0H5SG30_BRUMA|nr:Bm5075 [Brugia malayi]